jgi:hypothetical protein
VELGDGAAAEVAGPVVVRLARKRVHVAQHHHAQQHHELALRVRLRRGAGQLARRVLRRVVGLRREVGAAAELPAVGAAQVGRAVAEDR